MKSLTYSITIVSLFSFLCVSSPAGVHQVLAPAGVFKPASLKDLHGFFNMDEVRYLKGNITPGPSKQTLVNTAALAAEARQGAGTLKDLGGGYEFDSHRAYSGDTRTHSSLRVKAAPGVSLHLGGDAVYAGFCVMAESGTKIKILHKGKPVTTFAIPDSLNKDYFVRPGGAVGHQASYYVHFVADGSTRFDEIRFISGSLEVDNIAFSYKVPDFIKKK